MIIQNFNSQTLLRLQTLNTMFGLFKKKTEIEKLQESYSKILADAHKLSHSNRTASDKLLAEAELIGKKIDELKEAK